MPTKQIDVYKEWLGITETVRPLNHYQLLRLKQFEDDAAKVRENYRKMNAHVRKYGAGEYGPQSQQLLNEMAKAMLCLTDARRKGEYDASLGRKEAATGTKQTFEQMLLSKKIVDSNQLGKARTFADTVGLELRDAIVQQKFATAESVMPLYAQSIGLPFVDLADIQVDLSLVPRVPTYLARQHSCVPIMIDEGAVLMATPHPLVGDVEEELRLRIGMPVRTVLCTSAQINDAIGKHYAKDAAVAEMVSKSSAPSTSTAGGAAVAPTPEQAAKAKKQAQQFAIIGFCMTFMLTVIGYQTMAAKPTMTNALMYGVAAGVTASLIGFFVGRKKV